ncbi:OLC1v1033682C1 [Oldenlandia corymbosa var. corymbosa]|uniref:OLC1v1033682C1 n=1 Tax=Oldenlandia corymbosa var. corymbosa TaxID=529605 RepID=A0AAV1CPJ5_OLDCO|nr:OLC1v1033682C1 [Oldenlandia corymbosa var. corymbosa]
MSVKKLVEMRRWKFWLLLNLKSPSSVPGKSTLAGKGHSRLRHSRNKKNRRGLGALCKEMEACGGYSDIKVMWEMVNSSNHHHARNIRGRSKRQLQWNFCFSPA